MSESAWVPTVGERVNVLVCGYEFAGVVEDVDPRDSCVNPVRVRIEDQCWFRPDELALPSPQDDPARRERGVQ
jgi:hypothetical protein